MSEERGASTHAELRRRAQDAVLAWKRNNGKDKRYPASAQLINAITRKPLPLDPDDAHEEVTADDYDNSVDQAFFDYCRRPQRFQASPDNPDVIECPKDRLMRIGRESIEVGKPSELFLIIMEQTSEGRELPPASKRARETAQMRLDIAQAFRKFMAAQKPGVNFKEEKMRFLVAAETGKVVPGVQVLPKVARAALAEHAINFGAYIINAPRKGQRTARK